MVPIDEALRLIKLVSASNGNYLQDLLDRGNASHPIPLLPFVGAGLSMPMGFPSWTNFLDSLSSECGKQGEVAALLQGRRFEDAAEAVEEGLGSTIFCKRIAHTFGGRPSRECELRGAVLALPSLGLGAVATTNFDQVLERVFAEAGSPFEHVVWPSQVDSLRRAAADNKRCLIKIHGDAEERAGRVLTKSEYDAHYGSQKPDGLEAQLGRLFQGRTLLFLGCSLGNDRTMDVLFRVLGQVSGIEHFALLERPASDDQFYEKQRHLGKRGILPIWYPTGRHELLEPMLRALAKKNVDHMLLGQMEDFLADVRYLRKKDLIDQEIVLKIQRELLDRYWTAGFGGRQ
jgi:hypothetical protein